MMTTKGNFPLLAESDIVISGGGPAGVAAALAAARRGYRVLLLEQTGTLGGLATSGLVPTFAPSTDGERFLYGGIYEEIDRELCRRMGVECKPASWQAIDAEIMKRLLDDLVEAAGVRVLFGVKVCEAEVEDGRIRAIWAATAQGIRRITGRQFVDATGDGMLAMLAGAGIRSLIRFRARKEYAALAAGIALLAAGGGWTIATPPEPRLPASERDATVRLLTELDRFSAAEHYLERARKHGAPMPAGEQFLIRTLARAGRHAEAQELFRRRHKYWELKQP